MCMLLCFEMRMQEISPSLSKSYQQPQLHHQQPCTSKKTWTCCQPSTETAKKRIVIGRSFRTSALIRARTCRQRGVEHTEQADIQSTASARSCMEAANQSLIVSYT